MSNSPLLKRMPQALTISIGAHALIGLSALSLTDRSVEPLSRTAGHTMALELQAPTSPAANRQQDRMPVQARAQDEPEKIVPRTTMPAGPAPQAASRAPEQAAPVQIAPRPPRPEPAPEASPEHVTATPPNSAASMAPAESSGLTETDARPEVVEQPHAVDSQLIADYRASLQALLEKSKRYPRQAKLRRMEDEIIVSFTINENGGLETCTLLSSAGFSVLDDAALAAVRDAAPFPAPPAGMSNDNGKPITFEVPIVFLVRS